VGTIVIGTRQRSQVPPPNVVFEALTQPYRQPTRRWMFLLDDEHEPQILDQEPPVRLVWSSLWPKHPTARVIFDLPRDDASGTNLRWTLEVEEPAPSAGAIGHLRRRLNVLINANLRDYFDL
jgi:hypothetical protein